MATNPPLDDPAGAAPDPTAPASAPSPDPDSGVNFQELPKELGILLVTAGTIGFLLPGPGTPAILAGGLILWPGVFGPAENWFRKRFPVVHRVGMRQVGRYLNDLETRFPGATRRDDPA